MKEFLQKTGLRLLLLLVIWVLVTVILPRRYYMGAEYARWETVFGKLEDLRASSEHVNLVMGDSRPEMGLASRHLNAWNIALGGTSPVEGYYMLRLLENAQVDTLYLSYSPFHFHSQDCFHNRTEYFEFVDQSFIDEVMVLSQSLGDTVFAWNNWQWLDDLDRNFPMDWVQRQLRYLPSIRGLDNYRWYFGQRKIMQAAMDQQQLSYLFASDICPKDTSVQELYLEQRYGKFVPNPVNVHYFQQLLAIVAKRGIHLVWINMPLNEAIRQPSQKYYADYELWLKGQLPVGTPYWPMGYQPSCDFKDFSHLDADAAQEFGQRVSSWSRQPK